jgi:uncharacterized membrane protein YhiD involved in acid resistance
VPSITFRVCLFKISVIFLMLYLPIKVQRSLQATNKKHTTRTNRVVCTGRCYVVVVVTTTTTTTTTRFIGKIFRIYNTYIIIDSDMHCL